MLGPRISVAYCYLSKRVQRALLVSFGLDRMGRHAEDIIVCKTEEQFKGVQRGVLRRPCYLTPAAISLSLSLTAFNLQGKL